MDTFQIRCRLENPVNRSKSAIVSKLLVDSGSEYTWVPAATLEKIGVQCEK